MVPAAFHLRKNPKVGDAAFLVVGCPIGVALLWLAAGAGTSNGLSPLPAWHAVLALTCFVVLCAFLFRLSEPANRLVDPTSGIPMFGLALAKLWLVSAQDLCALGNYCHDDLLFLRLGHYIGQGRWLGPYDNLTLAKGPAYPIWVAFGWRAGIPLLLGEHLLYIVACAALVVALRPLIQRRLVLLAIYGLLLFNPMTYTIQILRVIREGIYPAETLLAIACAVGVHTRRNRPLRELLPWTVGLGLALAGFWLTREEAVWLLPSLALVLVPTIWDMLVCRYADRLARLAVCMLPVAIWTFAVFAVCALNWMKYGAYTTCEFRWHQFLNAYGALGRVEPNRWQQYIPVPQETRKRIYGVSPSFHELEPFLEGELGRGYARSSAAHFHVDTSDMAGGWFMWALRDAVRMAGHCENCRAAGVFYAKLADEVNRACDAGLLEAGARRASMLPPWRAEYGSQLLHIDRTRHVLLCQVCTFGLETTGARTYDGAKKVSGRKRHIAVMPHPPIAATLRLRSTPLAQR